MSRTFNPIIIIGMHRSGTSIVTRMLEGLGLFVGTRKEYNQEAIFFLQIDRWLLSQCGASWQHPQGIGYLLQEKEVRALTADYIARYLIESPRIISFMGWKNYLRYKSLFNFPVRWGWKCPLSTYTLPIWLDIFPSAKVIHVYRHGVDVANSLRQRSLPTFNPADRQGVYYKLRFLHWFRPKAGGFMDSMRCATLEGGLSLWEEYLSEARTHVERLAGQALEVKYEDLIQEPGRGLRQMADFCGLHSSEETFERVAGQVNKERAYAYRGSLELKSFADRVAGRLVAQNYSTL
jgi:hypothetical protein